MQVFQGHSSLPNSEAAVEQATCDWPGSPQLILAFCSTRQPAGQVALALQQKYPAAKIVGCTTTGEFLAGRHYRGSLVLAGIDCQDVRWSTRVLTDLKQLTNGQIEHSVADMFCELGGDPDLIDVNKFFCLSFFDGLSLREETVSACIADALMGVPLIGGSAGDDLKFENTEVICGDRSYSDAVVLAMAETTLPFQVFKQQHFQPTEQTLVVTAADPEKRRVLEINGYPAVEAYARVLGLRPDQVDSSVTFRHPVTFSCHGESYVRSIRTVEPDGSLSFYCAVEEGMVLEMAVGSDLVDSLSQQFQELESRYGEAQLVIGCNCILRAMEADQLEAGKMIEDIFQSFSAASIGFDTYGEQLNGLHINQTLVGLALGSRS